MDWFQIGKGECHDGILSLCLFNLYAEYMLQEPCIDPWVGKIPWRRERVPTRVFWAGEFHELCSPWDRKSRTQLRLNISVEMLSKKKKNPQTKRNGSQSSLAHLL